jgi:hypothetical protein
MLKRTKNKIRDIVRDMMAKNLAVLFVECEKCGCLLRRRRAFEGSDEIRLDSHPCTILTHNGVKKIVYTPYYCRRCKPKKGKN